MTLSSFRKKLRNGTNAAGSGGEKYGDDSSGAMLRLADAENWIDGNMLGFIPEIMDIYRKAAEDFFNIIDGMDVQYRESLMFYSCRYLFAKAVEGVILWGIAPDGMISVLFEPRDMATGEIKTELPEDLHALAVASAVIGEKLFRAHQEWVLEKQRTGSMPDIRSEIRKTLEWIPRIGVAYGLHSKLFAVTLPGKSDE